MSLVFIGQGNFNNNGANYIDLPFTLDTATVVIDTDSPLKKDSWNKAGDAIQVISLGSLDCEVADSYTYLSFNPTLIKFPLMDGNSYKIRFKPVPWLSIFTVNIYIWTGK